jgi:hypothetical protein
LFGLGRFLSFLVLHMVGLFGRGLSPSQGRYLHTEQHTRRINAHTDIHALSEIRTHDPSFRASEDSSCLRASVHCDRLSSTSVTLYNTCFNMKKLCILSTQWTSIHMFHMVLRKTAIVHLNSTNLFVFGVEMQCVVCAVLNTFLNAIHMKFELRTINFIFPIMRLCSHDLFHSELSKVFLWISRKVF